MRFKIFIFFLVLLMLGGCSTYKQYISRRNLMLPEAADLPRNKKFKMPKKKKSYVVTSKNKKKKRRKNYW